ncbi:GNAT family N-acetyltransferase [uncultured Muriicola sp.]|uniref:GNAT family N-acetyltransferase n=1 Tax=uncultured Muriicola sp. TaxID=1583102 RepID=UPI00262CB7A2|nr:GNAT family N-acetyltransferase [uncultured Muriicola sp.]
MPPNSINVAVFDQFPLLKSERLIFREFKDSDVAPFYALRTHKDVLNFMDTNPLENLLASEKMIHENHTMFQSQQGISWAITDVQHHLFMGYFLLWNVNHKHSRAEIGYALHPEYWGKGYMKETFKIMLPFAFKTLKLHRLEANINPNNKRSERLLIETGFVKEGHFKEHYLFNGKFLDSVIYSLLEKKS